MSAIYAMRTCRKCGQESMMRRYAHACKACDDARVAKHQGEAAERYPKCVNCGKPAHHHFSMICRECAPHWEALRHNAIRQVHREIAAGRLPSARTLTCVDCGSAAHDYDHRDYLKPLDVQPVCRACNLRRGPANTRIFVAIDEPKAKEAA